MGQAGYEFAHFVQFEFDKVRNLSMWQKHHVLRRFPVFDSRDGDVSEMRFKESNLRWGVDIFTPYTYVWTTCE